MKNRAIFLSIFLFVIFLMEGIGLAHLIKKITLIEMVKESDLIIEGTVSKIQSQWNNEKTMIYTDVEITVKQIEKGIIRKPSITIRLIGGRIESIAMIALGSPAFKKDESVFLFLKELQPESLSFFLGEKTASQLGDAYSVIGWNQGFFDIDIDSQTGQKILRQRAIPEGHFVGKTSEDYDLQNLTLSQLRDIIRMESSLK